MRRLQLKQVIKNWAAYITVSSVTIDAAFLLADQTGMADVPGSWYVNAPLAAAVLVGTPATFTLASRIIRQIDPNPGRITAFEEGGPSPLSRWIPFTANGRTGRTLAHGVKSAFGETLPEERPSYRPALWIVPIEGLDIKVRESELRAFLDVAWRRDKHQFSRRYWTRRRRPALYRPKYEAFMRLLCDSGLVEGRHEQGGASGRLLAFPREAVTFLKYESAYRTA